MDNPSSQAMTGSRQNYVLFADRKFIGDACMNMRPKLRFGSFLKLSVALGYAPTTIHVKDVPNAMLRDLRIHFFANGEKVVTGGVPMTSKSWIIEQPSLDFSIFRVFHLLKMGTGIIKEPYSIFIVSEEPGSVRKSYELFRSIQSLANREPISDEEFNVKLASIRQDIRQKVGNLEGLDSNLWPHLNSKGH